VSTSQTSGTTHNGSDGKDFRTESELDERHEDACSEEKRELKQEKAKMGEMAIQSDFATVLQMMALNY
jgi:hypothetical protein